jgi:AAA+ ATPase superfamily predicted ATPase
MNPFKFGSIVSDQYFTDRKHELEQVKSVLNSENHLILIGPRRYGKSSLIFKAVASLDRPVISLDLQIITSTNDLAAQLLKRIYRIYPFEQVRQYVKHFRILPVISLNPLTNSVDINFSPESENLTMIEDVLDLLEKLSKKNKKLIVIFDEFQEITSINSLLLKQLRSILQHHQKVNYVFLGSQESLIREIFEHKKSPFYHFGMIIPLNKIPVDDFKDYLNEGFNNTINKSNSITEKILNITDCHPYYTQQLAYVVWEAIKNESSETLVETAVRDLIQAHDIDYERLWMAFNNTDKKMLIGLSEFTSPALSEKFLRDADMGASSTAFSSIKRRMKSGYVIRSGSHYEIDDPFFKLWIKKKREE